MEEIKCPDTGETCACYTRHKHREPAEADALLRRLNRIEGQVRGIRGMVEKEVYRTDILTQVSAVQAALNAFARQPHKNLRGAGYSVRTHRGGGRTDEHPAKADEVNGPISRTAGDKMKQLIKGDM